MEISQENTICSYLYLKKAKMSYFSFYLFSVFFYKIRTGGCDKVFTEGRVGASERGEVAGNAVGNVVGG
jgi:hypothetical protein